MPGLDFVSYTLTWWGALSLDDWIGLCQKHTEGIPSKILDPLEMTILQSKDCSI
jgi:hypothetical protein